MEESNPIKTIEDPMVKYNVGFSSLWKIYGGINGLFESAYFWISVIVSSLFFFGIFLLGIENQTLFYLLNEVIEKTLMLFPSVLGFNIGAYALVIGFGDKEVLDRIRAEKGKNGYTLFQSISATFAASVLIQSFTLAFAFFISLFIDFFGHVNLLFLSSLSITTLNSAFLFMSTFFVTYSIVLIPKIVLNVFSFSQLFHFFSDLGNIEEDSEKEGGSLN